MDQELWFGFANFEFGFENVAYSTWGNQKENAWLKKNLNALTMLWETTKCILNSLEAKNDDSNL